MKSCLASSTTGSLFIYGTQPAVLLWEPLHISLEYRTFRANSVYLFTLRRYDVEALTYIDTTVQPPIRKHIPMGNQTRLLGPQGFREFTKNTSDWIFTAEDDDINQYQLEWYPYCSRNCTWSHKAKLINRSIQEINETGA